MTGWDDLTSAALVGTDRRPYSGDLLEAAAVETVRRRAGTSTPGEHPEAGGGPGGVMPGEHPDAGGTPGDATPPAPPYGSEEPGGAAPVEEGAAADRRAAEERAAGAGRETGGGRAPDEERAAVGRGAAERLRRILDGEHERLLPEWLAAAAATGRRVPPYVLPDLLERGRRDRSIRAHLGVLAGRRGRWLAGLNPAWDYLLDEPTGETWELGGAADRRAHLSALRAADPGQARALLESTWEQEGADDRAGFVEVLAEGLSMADEPFLERALDDRRREVRQAAANLLTRLPSSRMARRMAARLHACVTIDGDVIAVRAPASCDREMERDGIRRKPPRGIGEHAWWLQQIIARAPLSAWGRPPARLLAMKIPGWDAEVKSAWVRAAVLQRDPEWARAMFRWDPIADLLVALPPEEQQALAAGFAAEHDLDSQLIMVLGGVSPPWGEGLATAVLRKIVKVNATQPWNLAELVKLAGEHIDPALHELAEDFSPAEPVQQVAALLRFRADMYKELTR